MRHLIFAAALMTGLVWSHPGQATIGNVLYDRCTGVLGSYELDFCIGYVSGVVSTLQFYKPLMKHNICLPSEVSVGQAIDVVKKWLKENPKIRHWEAPTLILAASIQAWPCPKKNPRLRDCHELA